MTEKTYTRDFKKQTAKLITDGGASAAEIAKQLEIDPKTLYEWIRQFAAKPEDIFPGNGHLTSDAELISQLRREVERLQMECDILKKANELLPKDPA